MKIYHCSHVRRGRQAKTAEPADAIRKISLFRYWAVGLPALVLCVPALACGPFFPNGLLDSRSEAVLAMPLANFSNELARLRLPEQKLKAKSSESDFSTQTAEADLSDLRAALTRDQLLTSESMATLQGYRVEREKLRKYRQAAVTSTSSGDDSADGQPDRTQASPQPTATVCDVSVPAGLPDEFADYFRGSIAWHTGKTNEARSNWETLLHRPAADRHHRSTWAAYMLGKSWEVEDPDKAFDYFQQTRTLATRGFSDRLGLAAASVGWEARLQLRKKNFEQAIELYLDQLATGDDSAVSSLSLTVGRLLNGDPRNLFPLAVNPRTRWVINSFIISHRCFTDYSENINGSERSTDSILKAWLSAIEQADVKDMDSAEQLALAAYQAGDWDGSLRWMQRAQATPTMQWLQAKLLLRSGKSDQAAQVLVDLTRLFPIQKEVPIVPSQPGLADGLTIEGYSYITNRISAPAQMLAEMGVLHLCRREYAESLDALIRAGYWMDAAYVAERVLTVGELKNYVDRNWPDIPPPKNVETNQSEIIVTDDYHPPAFDLRANIRHLLARRLLRTESFAEAREYFPTALKTDYEKLVQDITTGRDASLPSLQRAHAYFSAGQILRDAGMELLGTEVEPDWHIHGGAFEGGVTVKGRTADSPDRMLIASEDETRRATASVVAPEHRFHYRYKAGSFAWAAAKLLPDDSDETARILCLAGSWLKNRDPSTADLFYKSLVRRCRHTAIGAQADRMRWFPDLDTNGIPVPWQPDPPTEITNSVAGADPASSAEIADGYWYSLSRGTVLQDVIEAVRNHHNLELTVEDLLLANPSINPNRLKAGLKIFVPISRPDDSSNAPYNPAIPES